jgi:hypothetical protein
MPPDRLSPAARGGSIILKTAAMSALAGVRTDLQEIAFGIAVAVKISAHPLTRGFDVA